VRSSRMASGRAAPPVVIADALLITQDANRQVIRGDLRVEGGAIVHVGPNAPREGAEIVDGHRFAIVPGLINTHTHVAMSLLRGIADDRDLGGFLTRLFAVDALRTDEDIEAGAAAGIAEMLLGGTTSFLDLYYGEDAVARAVARLGIRGFLGWAVLDPELTTQKGAPLENARRFIEAYRGHDRVTPLVAPQGVYVCSKETWLGARALADRYSTLCHFHLSETRKEVHDHEATTGRRPAIWLDEIGFFGPRMIAAHGVWLTRREIEILAHHGVGIAHCPSSNLKLATGGVAPVVELQSAGAVVGIGTDSVASNNSLSMLREAHLAGVLQKHHRWDAAALPAQVLLDMVTRDGAQILGRGADLGSLEVGKRGDFSLVQLDHPSMLPARPEAVISHLVYSASDDVVDSVYVDGEPVVRHRQLVRESWESIRATAEQQALPLWGGRVSRP
jgi:5-methylthioadenosine/S-adenosylhomocysteine deaminase